MASATRSGSAPGLTTQTRQPPTPFAEFHRPLTLGLSIGHPSGTVGSIGPFVTFPSGRPGLISASFVLAPKGTETGDWIHQPGPYDTSLLTGTTRIGKVIDVAAPLPLQPARVASASVELIDALADGNVIPPGSPDAGRRIVRVADPDELAVNEEVACIGCTSGYSRGVITDIRMDNLAIGNFKFFGAFGVVAQQGRNFSEAGDAGALIYRRSDMAALGLLFARNNAEGHRSLTLALPMAPALEALNVTLTV